MPGDQTPADLEVLLRRIIREETGITPVVPADKWRGGTLVLRAALGHPKRTDAALLHAAAEAEARDSTAARALGERAAAMLREQGAADYLAS